FGGEARMRRKAAGEPGSRGGQPRSGRRRAKVRGMLRWLSTVLVVTWPATALAGLPAGAERTAPRQRVDPLLATTVGAYSLAGTALVVGNVTAALSMAADADAEERCASLGVGAGSGCAAAEA